MTPSLTKTMLLFVGTACVPLVWITIAGAANEIPKQPENTAAPKMEEANALLSRARVYKRVESYDEAEKDIVDAIQKVTDPHLYDEAVSLWHEVEQAKQARVKRKAEAQLEEANRLISEGSAAEGATKANEVLASSNDPEIWEKREPF